ncbi:hypothetical protein HAX54_033343 [Datura stramonium]|uniref:Uncharacterized protein n=1 Tax=Datura stramonium TaxID=4076 RepID=A0ABS8SDA4_DATST|nr:hypothetical protein [Datura stramonium]
MSLTLPSHLQQLVGRHSKVVFSQVFSMLQVERAVPCSIKIWIMDPYLLSPLSFAFWCRVGAEKWALYQVFALSMRIATRQKENDSIEFGSRHSSALSDR